MRKVLSLMLIIAIVLTMASFPAFAAEISLSEANVIASPYTAMGSVAELFDGDEATGHLPSGLAYVGSPTAMTSNNEYVFNLGASYDNPELTLVWGSHGHGQWGYTAPDGYAVYYSADNSVYELAAEYTDLHANTTAVTLPAGFTASRTYLEEYVLTGITTVNATGVKYIKIVVTSYAYGGPMLKEVSVVGTPATSGDETPNEPSTEPVKVNIVSVSAENMTGDTDKIIDGLNGSAGRTGWESFKSAETIELGDGSSSLYSLIFDLGDKYAVTEIYSRWSVGYPTAGNIYASNDLTGEWTLVQAIAPSYTNEADWCSSYSTITVNTNGVGYQYYKLEATTSVGGWDGSAVVPSIVECFEVEITGLLATDSGETPDEPDVPETPDISNAATIIGSSIRLESTGLSAGLRFGALIDKATLGIEENWAYETSESDYEFGMYLLPEDMLEGMTLAEYIAAGGDKAAKVVAKKAFKQTSDKIEYTAVLVGIPESAWNRVIVAVPYVTNGTETTYYTEQTDSYVSVAQKALDSYNGENENNISDEDALTLGAIIETVYGATQEPAIITGITVTGEGITAWEGDTYDDGTTVWPVSHGFEYITDGLGGTGEACANGGQKFVSDEDVTALDSFSFIFDMGGQAYDVSEIYFVWSWAFAIKNATVYGSNDDGATWEPIQDITVSVNEWSATSLQVPDSIVELNCNGKGYSKFKIKATSVQQLDTTHNPTTLEIYEIEFTGIPATTGEGGEPSPVPVYYDIDAAASAQGLNYEGATLPASVFVLSEEYDGFKINGSYKVDAETLLMLTTVPCTGDGEIAYKDYREFAKYIATADPSWGQIDGEGYGEDNYGVQIKSARVSKLSDPVYMSMVLASEAPTYQDKDNKPEEHQNNGVNMHAPSKDTEFDRINALGAIYVNKDLKSKLKSDYKTATVTICIGNIKLLIRTADKWIEKTVEAPTAGFGMLYALPWQLEGELGEDYGKLCVNIDDKITQCGTYSKVTMKVSDFLENQKGQWWNGGTSFDERTFHFWGDVYNLSELGISEDTEILGVIASYEVWVEEEELAPYFVASVGADWRLENTENTTRQAFAGHQIVTTTDKQVLFGHSFGAEDYDTYVAPDLDKVKAMLGIQ